MGETLCPDPSFESIICAGREQLTSLVGVMPGWAWETDAEHRITFAWPNERACFNGPEDRVGQSRLEFFRKAANRGRDVQTHIRNIVEHRPFQNYTYRIDGANEDATWVSSSGEPRFNDDGEFCGYQGFSMTVTPIVGPSSDASQDEMSLRLRNASLEERVSENTAKLEEVNLILSDVVDGMAHGVLCFSSGNFDEQEIILANSKVADILELPLELVSPGVNRKKLLDHCTARGDFGDTSSDDAEVLFVANSEQRSVKYDRLVPSGRIVQSLSSFSASGTTVVTFTDITEIKRRETELEAARKSAVAANRAKSEFLANMSHEIRTPMNGVLGVAELLRATEMDDLQQSYAEVIAKSGKTLLQILNDILDFSKIEAGEMTLSPSRINLNAVAQEVIDLMKAAAHGKDIRLEMQTSIPDEFEHNGDRVRIMQIMTNLIGNGIKFTDKGVVRLGLSQALRDAASDLIRVEVSDTGVGIPQSEVDKIFENFAQVEGMAAGRPAGTGLGLAISKKLVSLMNGEIGVKSREGRGSTFWFEIPLAAEAPVATRAAGSANGT